MSFGEFVNRNEGFCMVAVIVIGLVTATLGGMAIYTRQLRVMKDGGYIEVQSQGTTSTHWEKAPVR